MSKQTKIDINPEHVYQVYLVMFKDVEVFDVLDILDELGEYRFNYNLSYGSKKKTKQVAYLNTNLHLNNLDKKFEPIRKTGGETVILGMTLDMMSALNDEDIRTWCLKKQEENMTLILEKTQQQNLQDLMDSLEEIEKEVIKIEEE